MKSLIKAFFSLFHKTNKSNYVTETSKKVTHNKNNKKSINNLSKDVKLSSKNNPQKNKNHYNPSKPFKISKNKLDLFLKCPRCFYLNSKLGIKHPSGYPLSLNIAVDKLLKKEFNFYRAKQIPHPIFLENNIEAIPFKYSNINHQGDHLNLAIQYIVPNTNFIFQGKLDDIWINPRTQELIVADYKATSKKEAVSLDADWQIGYKRQAEIYQWLLRKNGYVVSNIAYFVYCNGKTDAEEFNKLLHFDISLLPYNADGSWVESSINEAYNCLQGPNIPALTNDCNYCQYYNKIDKNLEKTRTQLP